MIWVILISLLAILLFLLAWILAVPLIIYLDTDKNRYYVSVPVVFKASFVPANEFFFLRFRIFFIPFKWDPFSMKTEKEKRKKKPDKPVKKGKSLRVSSGLRFARKMLGAFTIKKLRLDIDTDDFTVNAWLIPVFSAINRENIQLRANFEGYSSLLLDLRISIGTLLWVFIRNKIKSY